MKRIIFTCAILLCLPMAAQNQPPENAPAQKTGTLGVVATSHLDTQWRWTIQNTINEYVPATLRDNFKLFDLYPSYTFSFEGAFRYMLAKEYYPEEFERLKKYIADGRWRVAGSWVDAVDVNMPSFESLVRHALYGNGFYKREFGKTSQDILLPDCFGFGYALPSIAAHCGIKSFSTQKLSWGCSVPVPFDIGLWEGVDGSRVLAALRPGDYVSDIESDLTRDSTWSARVKNQGDSTGLYAAYRYFGTGDTGGAPESSSVAWLEKSIHSDGPLEVKSIGSDDLAKLVESNPNAALKTYNGELLMTRHGVGCYTSQAAMKRWNRKNELLADATERACVIADLMAVSPYPREALRDTWTRFLWHQFHDDLTGTSIPEAYAFSWGDEILCQNRFSAMLEHAVEAVASQLDTRVKGIPLVVYNPLSTMREDVVVATIPCTDTLNGKECSFMTFRVYDAGGNEVPSGVVLCDHLKNQLTLNFLARVPSVGFAVYDVRPAETMCQIETGLNVTDSTLENAKYLVKVNGRGEVASIYDKIAQRELLAAPIAFQFLHDKPDRWPAWEIQYEDIMAAPLASVIKSTEIAIEETGPMRVSLAITQKTEKSVIRTVVSLAAGEDANRVEFDNVVDWYESETLLKVAFPVTTPNDGVTYDIGLGTITRGINTEKKYEVPGQQWADISAKDSNYGVTVMNDCKYGWDHPDSATLRLSLIHTPGVYDSWNWVGDQKSQDMGRHEFMFAVVGHKGDWRDSGAVWQAAMLNQPPMAFRTTSHRGSLDKSYSLFKSNSKDPDNPQIKDTAIKKAEDGGDVIVRIQELWGLRCDETEIDFSELGDSINWVNGTEDSFWDAYGDSRIRSHKLYTGLSPFQPRAYSIKPKMVRVGLIKGNMNRPLELSFDLDVISLDANRTDGNLDGQGNTIAGELLPDTLVWLDVPYVFGPKEDGKLNVVSCKEQAIEIPHNGYDRLNLLVTSVGGPSTGMLEIDGKQQSMMIPDYATPLGQWNSRLSGDEFVEEPERIAPGYINTMPVAWYGSHRHTAKGENEAYRFTYVFLYSVDLPAGAKQITLPDNPRIKVLAATLVKSIRERTFAASPLYDRTNATLAHIHSDRHNFLDSTLVSISTPIPGAAIFYTLDGSEPDMRRSPSYMEPFAVNISSVVKARAFRADFDNDYVAQASFNKLYPHEAVNITCLSPGLSGRYYEGDWSKLPDFDTVALIREFTAESVAMPEFAREEDFGLTLAGYVEIQAEGLYQFHISSDDGSALYISDSLVVDNDGLHGEGEVTGEIALKAGMHPIAVEMFQCKGDRALELSIEGPGLLKTTLSSNLLFHKPGAKMRK